MKKKHKGFSQAFHYGKFGFEILIFFVRRADGKLYPAVTIRKKTRTELAKVLIKFRRARREIAASSQNLFGGNFPAGSLRWLACYCGVIKDFTCKHSGNIRKIKFTTPCLRSVLGFVG